MDNIDNYDVEQINNNGCLTICYGVEVIKEDGAATWESMAVTKQRRVHPDFTEAFKPVVDIIARMLEFPLINSYSEKLDVYPLKIRFVDSNKFGKGVRFTVRLSNFAESDEKITITTPTYYKLAKYTKEDSEGITPINELTAQEWLQLERLKKETCTPIRTSACSLPLKRLLVLLKRALRMSNKAEVLGMNRKDVINAANVLKKYCSAHDQCQNCIFKKDRGYCTLAYTACSWKIPKSDSEPDNCSSERIADLHREIELRDRRIYELEQQLAIKDSILKKQGVIIAELREEQSGC